jgi:hypothetical protein
MNKIRVFIWTVLILFLQILVFNNINFSGNINPYVYFIKLFFKKNNIDYLLFDLHTETFGQVFNYVVTLTIIHHFILFSLDNFSFQNMGTVLLNTLYSSVFTLTLYFAGSYILREKQLN